MYYNHNVLRATSQLLASVLLCYFTILSHAAIGNSRSAATGYDIGPEL